MSESSHIRPFNTEGDNIGQRWLKWLDRFHLFLDVKEISDEGKKINNLLYYGGEDVYDAYQPVKDTTADTTLKAVTDKLTAHFNPPSNNQISRFQFRSTKQFAGEKFDDFVSRLREIIKTCNYSSTSVEDELVTQIIQGCNSEKLQSRAMEKEIKLTELIALGKTIEAVELQMSELKKKTLNVDYCAGDACVNQVSTRRRNLPSSKSEKPPKCFNCGGEYPHKDGKCPAFNKTCNNCKKRNHFASCCRLESTRNDNQGNSSTNDEHKIQLIKEFLSNYESEVNHNDQAWSIETKNGKSPTLDFEIAKTRVKFIVDTGASINLMDEETYNQLKERPILQKSKTRITSYTSNTIPILGRFHTRLLFNKVYSNVLIHVVQGNTGNLLGYETLTKMGIIKMVDQIKVNALHNQQESFKENLAAKYPRLFSGKVGKLNDFKVKLHINSNIKPVHQKTRPTSIHLRAGVEKALKKMLDNDIIEPVTGATPWVSPIVPIIKSNGEIRICTDAKRLNTAIMREVHNTPTIEELALELNNAKFISKMDLDSGYNQLELDEQSRDITVFSTHTGLYKYKRLNFGISSAAEIFQKVIENVIQGIPGCKNLSDDIIVFGSTQEEHDTNLHLLLQRLESKGLTLNVKKCQFKQTQMDFFGLNFSQGGITLTQSKIDALLNASSPRSAKELKSLYGLINYCARFIKNAATLLAPFRELTKRNARWFWTPKHEQALDEVKKALTTEAMAFFNKDWHTVLTTDASPTGLGVVMSQVNPEDSECRKIVLYASRGLTPVERKYSQVEREALALVWACERLKLYLIGKEFEVITDNKAVELIFGNPKSKPCARLERWSLRLLPYSFKIRHEKGSLNIADFISRNASNCEETDDDYVEDYVNLLVDSSLPLSIKLEHVITETNKDEVLQKVRKMIETGNLLHLDTDLNPYRNIKEELTLSNDGLLLRNSKIVVPKSLQRHLVDIAHEAHQSNAKTRELLSQYVWFPSMSSFVDRVVSQCKTCKINSEKKHFEPLRPSPLPSGVWQDLAADFHGPIVNNQYLLVVVDEFSRFPIVKCVKSTSAQHVLPVLEELFQLFGIPSKLKTDNGPPFKGHEFAKFMDNMGVKHQTITPYWPRANAIVERFMRNLNRVMRISKVSGRDWKVELDLFLSHYRATPHDSTGVTPSSLMFKTTNITCRLPHFGKLVSSPDQNIESLARTNDQKAKAKMKYYFDRRFKVKPHGFQIGDKVLVKPNPSLFNKSNTKYIQQPFEISKIKDSMITARCEGKEITRNSSFFQSFDSTANKDKYNPILILEPEPSKLLPISSPSNLTSIMPYAPETPSGLPTSKCFDKGDDDYLGDLSTLFNLDGASTLRENELLTNANEENSEEILPGHINPESNTDVEVTSQLIGKRIRRPVDRYSDSKENERVELLKKRSKEASF